MSTTEITVTVPADSDADDCLAAAVAAYVADHPSLEGWDLSPRWTDETRETVSLCVPAERLWTDGNNAGDGYAPDADDVDEATDDLADGGEVLHRRECTSEIAVVRTATGAIVGIGGDGSGGGAWAVELVPAS